MREPIELTAAEIDTVSGGFLNDTNVSIIRQKAVAIGNTRSSAFFGDSTALGASASNTASVTQTNL